MLALDANTTRQTGATVTSDSFAHTCTTQPRRCLFVIAFLHGTANPYNVVASYGGVTMTKLGEHLTPVDDVTVAAFYLTKPASGSNNVALSWALNAGGQIIARSYIGVHQGTPVRTGSYTTGSITTNTASIAVPSASGDIVMDGMGCNTLGSSTAAVGAGQTSLWSVEANSMRTAFSVENGAVSVTMSWTLTNVRTGHHVGFSIMPAALNSGIGISPSMFF